MTKIIKLFKLTIHNILKYFGLKLVSNAAPIKAKDIGVVSNNKSGSINISCHGEVNARYISYLIYRNTVLVDVPTSKGRGNPVNTYGTEGNHPFVFASRMANNKVGSSAQTCIYGILEKYYSSVNPSSAGELAGVSRGSILYKYPAWGLVMPWESHLPEFQIKKIERVIKMENYNFNRSASIENGWAWVGPADEEKCMIESRRLANILESITVHGYKRHDGRDGDIRAIILVNESNEWVWQSTGAQHRAAVLSAMGYEYVPVRIHKVIRREEVKHWPNVVNGLYSVKDATLVFDNIFEGRFDHVTSEWDDYLKSNRLVKS